MDERDGHMDEILGITRCVQCGQRLDGEIECPFCAAIEAGVRARPRAQS